MAARFLIVDGYNLMHAAGLARATYGHGDLAHCRNRLLRLLLGGLSHEQQARTTIVFDARDPPPGAAHQYRAGAMLVLFARPHGDADVMIEDLLAAHSAPKQVTVVSSDRRLCDAAARRKAHSLDSETFADRLNHPEPVDGKPTPEPDEIKLKAGGALPPDEANYWLSVFKETTEEINDSSTSEFTFGLPDLIGDDFFDDDRSHPV